MWDCTLRKDTFITAAFSGTHLHNPSDMDGYLCLEASTVKWHLWVHHIVDASLDSGYCWN